MAIDVIPGEISTFTIAVAIVSGFILFFGYISMFLKEKLSLSEALVAVIAGIIAGPLVTGGLDPSNWAGHDEITKQLTRCIIAIQVMSAGIELPKHYMKKEWLTMFILLVPVMIFMWLVSGLFIWELIPSINYLEALVISACICPTDPILANSVVKGKFAEKHVPANIRNALSAESGANDGMGFPFLFLAILLMAEDNIGTALGKWVYITCLFQIALSCIIGIAVGYAARKGLQWSERNHLIDKPSFLAFVIALALFLMSMTGFSGIDDLLACFAAGNAFSWDEWFGNETEQARFREVIDMMLNLGIFVYIGAVIPWHEFGNASIGLAPWRLVVIAVLVLLFRRLPVVILLKPVMPAIKTYREAIFSGWFGPMGVSAVFLSTVAKEELDQVYKGKEKPVSIQLIAPIVLFIVFCSVLVHGITIPLFKLGSGIKIRTLSVSSVSSSQISKLSKFGQKGSKQHRQDSPHEEQCNMTELDENTLYNTRQHPSHPVFDMPTNKVHRSNETLDIAEEDLLPDDSSGTLQNTSHIALPKIMTPDPTSRSSNSVATQQAIRFSEPVKPHTTPAHASKTEGNKMSVTSLKSWLLRQSNSESESNISRGIVNLFRRSKDVLKEGQLPTTDSHQQELGYLFHRPVQNYPIDPTAEVSGKGNDIVVVAMDKPKKVTQFVH